MGTTVCKDGFTTLCLAWSPDWRLVFGAGPPYELQNEEGAFGLWQVPLKKGTAERTGKPVQLAHWTDSGPLSPNISRDGKNLSFLKTRSWQDVYLAGLTPERTLKNAPRRFTLDNRGSYLNAWMPGSEAILFSSDRSPTRAIFKQDLAGTVPEIVVQSPDEDCEGPVFTSDRKYMLFRQTKHVSLRSSAPPVRLMRRAVSGGLAETVLQEAADTQWSYACGATRGSGCILSQVEGIVDRPKVVFYALDPLRGKGAKLTEFSHLIDMTRHTAWSLSRDGSRIAYVTNKGQIETMSLNDHIWNEIPLPPPWHHLQTVAWADDRSVFVTCWMPDSSDLLRVTLHGQVTRLLHNGHNQFQTVANPLPSPDGKYLAYQSAAWDSNLWMIENF